MKFYFYYFAVSAGRIKENAFFVELRISKRGWAGGRMARSALFCVSLNDGCAQRDRIQLVHKNEGKSKGDREKEP